MRPLTATLVAAGALAAAAPARAGVLPSSPPAICAGSAFTNQVGTSGRDSLAAPNAAQRLYGLGGPDTLLGSGTRASCLFGGDGADALSLGDGGGVAWGEAGPDVIFGSPRGDVLDGGAGTDSLFAGGGDDKISTRDGNPEVVLCGAGDDVLRADRRDALSGCESVTATGPALRRLPVTPRRTDVAGAVSFRLRLPTRARGGAYRVLYLTEAGARQRCGGGPREVARFPKPYSVAREGKTVRVTVTRPPLGWCPGTARLAIVRKPGAQPAVPVARASFSVR